MRPWLASALLLTSCARFDAWDLAPEALPDSVAFVALIGLDANESIAGATGLVPRGVPTIAAFERTHDVTELVLVGYDAESITSLEPPKEAELRRALLTRVVGDEPPLPDPVYAARGAAESGVLTPGSAPFSLSAPWLGACRSWVPEGASADIRCIGCGAPIRQRGCGMELGPNACLPVQSSGAISGDRWNLAPGDALGSCLFRDGGLECSGGPSGACAIEIHAADTAAFDVSRHALVSGPFASSRGRAELDAAPYGQVLDLIALDDVWVVAQPGDAATDWRCPFGAAPAQGTLHFVDRELAPVRTASAPPCLTQLEPSGDEQSFFAVAGGLPQVLLRLDAGGRVLATRLLDEPEIADRAVIDMKRTADGTQLALLFSDDDVARRTQLLGLRTSDLGVSFYDTENPKARAIVATEGARIATLVYDDGAAIETDLRAVFRGPFTKVSCHVTELKSVNGGAFVNGELFLHSRAATPRLYAASWPALECDTFGTWSAHVTPDSMSADPTRPDNLFLAGSTASEDEAAWLFEIDVPARRQRPGATQLGRGPAIRVSVGTDGAVVGLLPATGEIFRAQRRAGG